jgi:hypothetical protein
MWRWNGTQVLVRRGARAPGPSNVIPIRRRGRDQGRPRLEGVNPRYRRLVIPGALVGLILIVVVAALLRG